MHFLEWKRRQDDKPLSEPMMVRLLTHICVTRPQWVKNRASQFPYKQQYVFHIAAVADISIFEILYLLHLPFNLLRPRQNGSHFSGYIFTWIFLNENVWITLKISLKFASEVWINNIPALVRITAWRLPGHKPLSEPMMINLLMHTCVTRPQWVKARGMHGHSSIHA